MYIFIEKVKRLLQAGWEQTAAFIVWLIDRLPRRFELSGERKAELWGLIEEDSRYTQIYWVQMGLASLIATLGLLQNSTAVVIGAMLVAPLLKPMQGMAYGIASAQGTFFLKNLKVLLWSIVLCISIGFLTLTISPLTFETSEILARVSPNFLDLLIAVASAAIAFLALSFRSLSSSIAGVAMAASLVPPLAVTGITLALGNGQHAWGSFFLFFTNLMAIILIGVLVFFLYGYRPHQEGDRRETARRVAVLFMLMLVISVPLSVTLSRVAYAVKTTSSSRGSFDTSLQEVAPEARIVDLQIEEPQRKKPIVITATLALPESTAFFFEDQNEISNLMAQNLSKDVEIEFIIVRTSSVKSAYQQVSTTPNPKEQITQLIQDLVLEKFKDITIVQSNIYETQTEQGISYVAKLVLTSTDQSTLTDFEEALLNTTTYRITPSITVLLSQSTTPKTAPSARELHAEYVKGEVAKILRANLEKEGELESVSVSVILNENEDFIPTNISSYAIQANITSSLSAEEIANPDTLQQIRDFLGREFSLDITRTPIEVFRAE